MAREKSSAEGRQRRQTAFALFCTTDAEGKRPTYRSIALKCGVTLNTVHYWRRQDHWEERLEQSLDFIAGVVGEEKGNLKSQLRAGSLEAVMTLRSVVMNGKANIDDRIKASQALFKIAKDAGAIDLDLVPDPPAAGRELEKFNDELPGDQQACSDSTMPLPSLETSVEPPSLGLISPEVSLIP